MKFQYNTEQSAVSFEDNELTAGLFFECWVYTAGLCITAVVLSVMLELFEGLSVMPIGPVILCLNTPIYILFSCDPDLEQAGRYMTYVYMDFTLHYDACMDIKSTKEYRWPVVSSVTAGIWRIG